MSECLIFVLGMDPWGQHSCSLRSCSVSLSAGEVSRLLWLGVWTSSTEGFLLWQPFHPLGSLW